MSNNYPYNYRNYSTQFVPKESGRVIYSFLQKNVSNKPELPIIVLNMNGILTKDEQTKEVQILVKIGGDEPKFTIDPNRLEGNFNFRKNTYNARKYVNFDYKPGLITIYIKISKLCFSKDPAKNTFSLNLFLNDCSCSYVEGNTYPVVYLCNTNNSRQEVGFLYNLDYPCGNTDCANPCDCTGTGNDSCENYWGYDYSGPTLPSGGTYGYCNTNQCIGDTYGNACLGLTAVTSYTLTETTGELTTPFYYVGNQSAIYALVTSDQLPALS